MDDKVREIQAEQSDTVVEIPALTVEQAMAWLRQYTASKKEQ